MKRKNVITAGRIYEKLKFGAGSSNEVADSLFHKLANFETANPNNTFLTLPTFR